MRWRRWSALARSESMADFPAETAGDRRGGRTRLAGTLQLEDAQGAFAAGDDHTIVVKAQHRARTALTVREPDVRQLQIAEKDPRPRVERAEAVIDRARRFVEGDLPFALLDLRRMRGLRMILLDLGRHLAQHDRECLAPELRESFRERRCPLVGADFRRLDAQHGDRKSV